MSELHFVFLKYNADRGAAVQEKEGRCGGGGGGVCYVTPSLPALSLYSASQSRNCGPKRLIGKDGRVFTYSAVSLEVLK